MSEAASNISGVMIASSVPIFALGAAATGVLWGSGHADPTVIAWVCAGVVALPVALAAPVLAVKGLMKSAKQVVEAAPPVIHQHYSGPITQTNNTIHAENRGIWAKTRNELPH
jgi:predicted Co/Zn/Cd cation transporter (cation efflux family)